MWRSMTPKYLVVIFGGALLILSLSCRARETCGLRPLSNQEIRKNVEAYFEKQGTPLENGRKVIVTIKRDKCDYLYLEEVDPPMPGFHFLVRLDEAGRVTKVVQGK
jgi:hypothetical protein